MTTIQPEVVAHFNFDACRQDNFEVLDKQTPLSQVIKRCWELGSHGFARSSLKDGCGKYYIRNPSKNSSFLESKLKEYKNVTFFIVKYT